MGTDHKRRIMKNLFSLCVAAAILWSTPAMSGDDQKVKMGDFCMEAFQKLELENPPKETIAEKTGAWLAWGESYRLMAYVAMYESSGDIAYLKRAVERIDEVLKMRDDKRAIKDEIRGKVVPAWSSIRYTKGKAYAWIGQAGMITYPVARCAYLLMGDQRPDKSLRAKAVSYVRAIEETVLAYDTSWREDKEKAEGWYYSDYVRRRLPFSHQNALGRTLVTLWLVTQKQAYREKAEKLARFLKNRLKQKDKGYLWSHWPDRQDAEDISHAAINVDFAFVCYRANLIFKKEDLMRFSETLKACAKDDKGFVRNVDGSGNLNISDQMGRWGHLGFVDGRVRNILYRYVKKNPPKNPPIGMITAAYLLETQKGLQKDSLRVHQ
jgi:hypothetical protein